MIRYLHKERFSAEHRSEDTPLIADVVREFRPRIVIELGVRMGGMSALFADVVGEWGGEVHAFDIERQFPDDLLEEYPNLTFHEEDVLDLNQCVLSLIRQPQVVLYCDNGNKEKEIAIYGPEMAVGNLIGCHDYDSEARVHIVEHVLKKFGYVKHRHSEFEDLVTEDYPISMTRFWKRVHATRRHDPHICI